MTIAPQDIEAALDLAKVLETVTDAERNTIHDLCAKSGRPPTDAQIVLRILDLRGLAVPTFLRELLSDRPRDDDDLEQTASRDARSSSRDCRTGTRVSVDRDDRGYARPHVRARKQRYSGSNSHARWPNGKLCSRLRPRAAAQRRRPRKFGVSSPTWPSGEGLSWTTTIHKRYRCSRSGRSLRE